MKKTFLLLLLLITFCLRSQSFVSGNVFTNANGCDYQINGDYYQLGNSTPLVFVYDSALTSYKFLAPISSDSVVICLSSTSCNCQLKCVSSPVQSGMIINIEICNITDLQKIEKKSKIYPIPFQNFLIFENFEKSKVMIYDSQMNLLVCQYFIDKVHLQTDSWSTGLYFILIDDNRQKKIFKVVK